MGTRSLTFVYSEDNRALVNMYGQYDGYMSGHGLDLAKFLNSFAEITNGISINETRKTANGMGCLAAQMIAHFKTGVGNYYLEPTDVYDCGQDYTYRVYSDRVMVYDYNNKQIFAGTWAEFLEVAKNDE